MSSKLVVIGKFRYAKELMPNNVEEITRYWPCMDERDGELIVRRHMSQTGALGVQCVVTTEEDFNATTRNANG